MGACPVARSNPESAEVETVGQAAETGNLCTRGRVPTFLISGAEMAVGSAVTHSEGDREPAPTPIFLQSWGPHSPSVVQTDPVLRTGLSGHVPPPSLLGW